MTQKMGMAAGLAVVALLWVDGVAAQTAAAAGQGAVRAERMENERNNLEIQRVPAFRAFDNLYYVGVGWVGSWLLTTTDGLILIDTTDRPAHVDHLLDGVRKIGFDPMNIKYVIITQAHGDHYSGAARIQREFGAQVAMGEGDWLAIEAPPTGRGRREQARDAASGHRPQGRQNADLGHYGAEVLGNSRSHAGNDVDGLHRVRQRAAAQGVCPRRRRPRGAVCRRRSSSSRASRKSRSSRTGSRFRSSIIPGWTRSSGIEWTASGRASRTSRTRWWTGRRSARGSRRSKRRVRRTSTPPGRAPARCPRDKWRRSTAAAPGGRKTIRWPALSNCGARNHTRRGTR